LQCLKNLWTFFIFSDFLPTKFQFLTFPGFQASSQYTQSRHVVTARQCCRQDTSLGTDLLMPSTSMEVFSQKSKKLPKKLIINNQLTTTAVTKVAHQSQHRH